MGLVLFISCSILFDKPILILNLRGVISLNADYCLAVDFGRVCHPAFALAVGSFDLRILSYNCPLAQDALPDPAVVFDLDSLQQNAVEEFNVFADLAVGSDQGPPDDCSSPDCDIVGNQV